MTTSPPFPPRCAARFRQERLLGQGGFGAVFRAFDTALDRPCVVKLLHLGPQAGEEAVRRFRNEAKVTAQLRHPAVVEVLDHDVEDGVPWIAYELLEGRDLRRAMDAGELTLPGVLAAALAVCGALDEAHRIGILHRDLKPENVMQLAAGGFKLMDFGIAKWNGRSTVQTEAGTVIGTPPYLAPEIWRGRAASLASDLYSLGVMIHELSTGSLPFAGELSAVISGHLNDAPPRASQVQPGLPRALDGVLATLLAKDPADRPASAASVANELEKLLASLKGVSTAAADLAAARERVGSVPTRPASRAPKRPVEPRPPRARPSAAAAVAAAAVACVALLGSAAWMCAPGPAVVATASTPSPSASAAMDPYAELRRRHPEPLDLLRPTCGGEGDEKACIALIRSRDPAEQVRGKLGDAVRRARKSPLPDPEFRAVWALLDHVKKKQEIGPQKDCALSMMAYLCLSRSAMLTEPLWIYERFHVNSPGDPRHRVGRAVAYAAVRLRGPVARDAYRDALAIYPGSIELRAALVDALLDEGSLELARAEIGRMATDGGGDLAGVRYARALHLEGRFQEARAQLNVLVERPPTNPNAVGDLGWALISAGRFEEAVRLAEPVADLHPEHESVLDVLCHGLLRQRRFADLEHRTRKILERDRNHHTALVMRVHALAGDRRLEEALAAAEDAIERPPLPLKRHDLKVFVLREQVRLDTALAYASSVPGDSQGPDLLLEAAAVHRLRDKPGDQQSAVELLTRALEARPDEPPMLCRRAESYLALGQLQEAQLDIDAAARRAPGDDTPLVLRARLELKRGAFSAARRALAAARERNPSNANLQKHRQEIDEQEAAARRQR